MLRFDVALLALIAQMLAHSDFLESAILQTHQRIEVLLRPSPTWWSRYPIRLLNGT